MGREQSSKRIKNAGYIALYVIIFLAVLTAVSLVNPFDSIGEGGITCEGGECNIVNDERAEEAAQRGSASVLITIGIFLLANFIWDYRTEVVEYVR